MAGCIAGLSLAKTTMQLMGMAGKPGGQHCLWEAGVEVRTANSHPRAEML